MMKLVFKTVKLVSSALNCHEGFGWISPPRNSANGKELKRKKVRIGKTLAVSCVYCPCFVCKTPQSMMNAKLSKQKVLTLP